MKFTPGPGIGGHCIPLDPHYLAWKMKALNYRTRLIELASEINGEMPLYVLAKITDALNRRGRAVNGSRVLLVGVAYKKDVADTRESPALDLLRLLEARGAAVRYHDPFVAELELDGITRRGERLDDELLTAIDLVVIATDHTSIDYQRLARAGVPIVDTRNRMRGVAGAEVIGLSNGGRAAGGFE
jgi:UDP-N-acetyl-D-glucosamine dehydrogenase